MGEYRVRVAKDSLAFSAAHFITLSGGVCEPLHGHDYRVAVEVEGSLDANQCVADFLAVEAAVREIVGPWDHQVLLPMRHPRIHVSAGNREVEVRFEDRRWLFPRGDCQLLDVANTTAELLAETIASRFRAAWTARTGAPPSRVGIELTEGPGYRARFEIGAESP